MGTADDRRDGSLDGDLEEDEVDSIAAVRMSSWDLRGRIFRGSLSPARIAEIARRPRFRNLPWLRRSDEPDQDQLP